MLPLLLRLLCLLLRLLPLLCLLPYLLEVHVVRAPVQRVRRAPQRRLLQH